VSLGAPTMPTNNYISVIEKTTRVLEAFDGSQRLSLREVAKSSHLVKSNVFRILFTLQRLGYVEKTKKGHYELTGRLRLISGDPQVWALILEHSKPIATALVRCFQETVNIGVLDGPEVSYLHIEESPHALRFAALAGMRGFIHSTALGKCLVSRLPRNEIEKIFKRRPLRAMTDRTIRDKPNFYRELEGVIARGYAIDNEEDSRGVRCIAAPVMSTAGRVLAALSISAPITRLPASKDRAVSKELINACDKIATSIDSSQGRTFPSIKGGYG